MNIRILLLTLLLFLPVHIWGISVKDAYPDPSLNPSDVVKLQLSAIRENNIRMTALAILNLIRQQLNT